MALMALDFAADLLAALMAQRLTGGRIRKRRAVVCAILGAAGAYILRSLPVSRAGRLMTALPLAYLLGGIACGGYSIRHAALLLASFGLLGGTMTALHGAAGSLPLAWGLGAAAAGAMAASMRRAGRAAMDVRHARVTICVGGHTASFEAIVDSGNTLRDYLTHRPVIVLPQEARRMLGLEKAPLRLLFADTAGGRQMMRCFTPEKTQIEAEGNVLQAAACAAFSPGLSPRAPALLPSALIVQHTDRDTIRD